ncbi:hypothetical protein Y032_0180g770 [Ancylostoma ceylanicum]|nr:hypothetical protein Y032_0180g770 [Ancylostoma ceylanicum]
MKQVRVDINHTKKVQLEVAKFPQSSDAIVREVTNIISQQADMIVGKCAKGPNLQVLPEIIVDTLIGCCLDAFRLAAPELDLTKDELMENPTKYWLRLGRNDDMRGKVLSELKDTRNVWTTRIRQALGRAL